MQKNFTNNISSLQERPTISRREIIIAGFSVIYLLLSAFYYSSVPWQAQIISCAIAGASFAFLFLPIGYDGLKSKTARESWNALKKFPPFWLGLALFTLMLIQGLNPALGVVQRTFYWKLYIKDYITWLPSGVAAPYVSESAGPGGMNAFRQMVIFGGPWFLLCSLWAGVVRRRLWIGMGWVVTIAGLLMVVWGVGMRLSHRTELSLQFNLSNTSFFGTFLYQNQAGAWISLLYAVAVVVSLWHWQNSQESGARGGPHLVGAVVAVLFILAMPFTVSFGGMFSIAICTFLITPIGLLWIIKTCDLSRGVFLGGAITTGLLAGLVAVYALTADLSAAEAKLRAKFELAQGDSLDDRAPMRLATWELITSEGGRHLIAGHGAGSYRWVSPAFLVRRPEFQTADGKLKAQALYAHCDWLQMLAEWGIAGAILVSASVLWAAWFFLKNIRLWTPAMPILLGAILLFMLHAGMDFLSYTMALTGMVAFVFVFAARLGLRRE